jgi:hypothetical protein
VSLTIHDNNSSNLLTYYSRPCAHDDQCFSIMFVSTTSVVVIRNSFFLAIIDRSGNISELSNVIHRDGGSYFNISYSATSSETHYFS